MDTFGVDASGLSFDHGGEETAQLAIRMLELDGSERILDLVARGAAIRRLEGLRRTLFEFDSPQDFKTAFPVRPATPSRSSTSRHGAELVSMRRRRAGRGRDGKVRFKQNRFEARVGKACAIHFYFRSRFLFKTRRCIGKEEEMRKAFWGLMVCMLSAGALVTGCGGSDKGGSGTTAGVEAQAQSEAATNERSNSDESGGDTASTGEATPLSKSEFVAKASAICTKRKNEAQAKLQKIVNDAPADTSQEKGLRLIIEEAVGPQMEAEAEELRGLGSPSGDEEDITAIVAAIQGAVAEVRKDPSALLAKQNPLVPAQRLARKYGVAPCGRVS